MMGRRGERTDDRTVEVCRLEALLSLLSPPCLPNWVVTVDNTNLFLKDLLNTEGTGSLSEVYKVNMV